MTALTRLETRIATPSDEPPLVVDLDGTLIRTDLLIETGLGTLGEKPREIIPAMRALMQGKAALKGFFAGHVTIDPKTLPYDDGVIALMREAHAKGRRVIIATAADRRLAEPIAAHLGIVHEVLASENGVNLSRSVKGDALVARFGKGGFDYIGNSKDDLPIWSLARKAYVAGGNKRIAARARAIDGTCTVLPTTGTMARALLKAMRPTQWVKNVLVFVPLLTAHQFTLEALFACMAAFFAFSLVASGVYLLNDLVDVASDRAHPIKRRRPFAAGTLAPQVGLVMIPLLWAAGLGVSALVSPFLTLVVILYAIATTLYSFSIKRKMLIDVVWLSGLYTVRIYGGAAATGVVISEWLLTFSIFIFTALALVKRYSELATRLDAGLEDPSNRNYRRADLPVVAALAASSAMASIVIIALYVASPEVKQLYTRPELLWFMCPVLLYWGARLVMMSHRRHIDGDPIVFALKDHVSWITGAALGAIILAAM